MRTKELQWIQIAAPEEQAMHIAEDQKSGSTPAGRSQIDSYPLPDALEAEDISRVTNELDEWGLKVNTINGQHVLATTRARKDGGHLLLASSLSFSAADWGCSRFPQSAPWSVPHALQSAGQGQTRSNIQLEANYLRNDRRRCWLGQTSIECRLGWTPTRRQAADN